MSQRYYLLRGFPPRASVAIIAGGLALLAGLVSGSYVVFAIVAILGVGVAEVWLRRRTRDAVARSDARESRRAGRRLLRGRSRRVGTRR
jgi:hypothetical protein